MGQCKKDITPLLTHWSYVFLAPTHWSMDHFTNFLCQYLLAATNRVPLRLLCVIPRDVLMPPSHDSDCWTKLHLGRWNDISWKGSVISIMASLFPVKAQKYVPEITRQIWGIWKLRPAHRPETPNLGQNRWCFVPCDLEIWWMTLENNRVSLLCCFKLCATFHSHWWIQTGVTLWKRPIWVKFDNF